MVKYKQKLMHVLDPDHTHYYDKREKFILPDGGYIHLDLQGKSFENITNLKEDL